MRGYTYVLPWLLSYFAANCVPVGEEQPNLEFPGIGVELEVRQFKLVNNKQEAKDTRDDSVIASVKGATLIPFEENKVGSVCSDYWALTAEHGGREPESGISDLTWEWIINGQTLKLKKTDKPEDDLVLPGVWKDIVDNLKILDPKRGDKFLIDYVDVKWGEWTLEEPEKYDEKLISPGVQVTTCLPMEAIQDLISIAVIQEDASGNEKINSVLLPLASAKKSNMVLITKEDLADVYESSEDILNDMLGFYSLLMSYVKVAITMTDGDRDLGPKQKLSIMPRTDWITMYNMYAKEDDNTRKTRCRPKKKKPDQTLLEIVKDLAAKKNLEDIESATFKWLVPYAPPRPTVPIPRSLCRNPAAPLFIRDRFTKRAGVDTSTNWPSKDTDKISKNLSVKTWLEQLDQGKDTLSVMDKLVWDGQIGGFGDRLEGPLYPEEAVDDSKYPLFELRDISGGSMNQIENLLIKIETQVKQWHKSPPASPAQKRRKRALGNACKKPSNDKKCEGIQTPNAKGKCEDCEKGMKPNILHTQCVKDKCMGNMAPNAQGKCESCAKGTKPNVGNTVCVPEGPDNEKKRGKCKDEGYILDPAQGGQDDKTENPVCTLDDSKKCEEKGWTPVTRSPRNKVGPKDAKSYSPECAKDEDPEYRCKNSKTTYHHMERDMHRNDDKKVMKHSCRATRDTKKQQKEKYQKRVDIAKEQKKQTTSTRKTEKKETNRRGRNGFCFALLVGIGAWDLAEIEAMSPDEVDGMMELWPENDMDPNFLDDHMVTVGYRPQNAVVGGIETETAGRIPIVFIVKGIIKLFKIFSKPARAAAPATRKAFYSEVKNAGSRSKAPPKSVNAAKSSGTVGKLIKDQRFLDCLAAAPVLAAKAAGKQKRADPPRSFDVNDLRVVIDWDAQRNSYKIPGEQFEDRQITVKLGADTDDVFGDGGATDWAATYPDRINRPGRLVYEDCQTIPDNLKNKVTALETWGGCCSFYADNDCKESSIMFSMTDREDWQLDGKHNDNLEAVWCTFEENCKGAPGARV